MISKDNLFILSDEEKRKFIFAPFSDYVEAVDVNDVSELSDDYIAHIPNPTLRILQTSHDSVNLTNLMILPNNKCNFSCSYCFSAQGRGHDEIKPEILSSAIQYFFSKERLNGRKASLSILGGGEPLLSWDIVKKAVELSEQLYSETHKTRLSISIVTNCSLINDEFVTFCLNHHIGVTASFDILEEIQNKHRGKYEIVLRNICRMTESGIPVDITAVITRESVNMQEEMIKHIKKHIPMVARISFRYVLSANYCTSTQDRILYYRSFIDNFFKAQTKADEYGLKLTCPYQNLMTTLADRHCPGKFVLTPSGDISTCFCVSSKNEMHFDDFVFGKVNDKLEIKIDEKKLKQIFEHDKNFHHKCETCPAQWNCAGGCYSDDILMTPQEHEAYCDSMRYFLTKYLIKKHKPFVK